MAMATSHLLTGMGRLAARLPRAWADAVLPPGCAACGQLVARPRSGPAAAGDGRGPLPLELSGGWLCGPCAADWQPLAEPFCPCCGLPFVTARDRSHLCGECLNRPRRFDRARAVALYDGTIRVLVRRLKYGRQSWLAPVLGRLLWEAYRRFWSAESVDCVVAVALHPRRMRRRGFNQSALMLRRWPGLLGDRRSPTVGSLVRRRRTAPQTGLGRAQRRANLAGAFGVRHPEAFADRHVLLVDDVYTTGATAEAAAGALKDAGARRVDVLTLARVQRPVGS